MVIPEFILLHTIKKAIELIKADLITCESNNLIEESYLYRVFQNTQLERYNYFEQIKAILLKKKDDPRLLKIDLMYNMSIERVPSIYITLPGEQHGGMQGLGMEQESQPYVNADYSTTNIYNRRKSATYGIYIVSDNSNEVNLLYHFIDCLLISATPALVVSGLYNLRHGGQDIQLENDKIPKHHFIKAISLGLEYAQSAPEFHRNISVADLIFKGVPTGLKSDPKDTENNDNDL